MIDIMSRGYTVLAYYILLLQNVPLDRCYISTVLLITDTVLPLVVVFVNDRTRVLLRYCYNTAFQPWILYSYQSTLDMFNVGFYSFQYKDFNVYILMIENDYLDNGSYYSHYWKIIAWMEVLKVLSSDINISYNIENHTIPVRSMI